MTDSVKDQLIKLCSVYPFWNWDVLLIRISKIIRICLKNVLANTIHTTHFFDKHAGSTWYLGLILLYLYSISCIL